MKQCAVGECARKAKSLGFCPMHYMRFRRHGDPTVTVISGNYGDGHLRDDGYVIISRDGKKIMEHVAIAERALGRTMPLGAVVHHVDEDRSNNAPNNLVICPDDNYHQLIHRRTRALEATGHADWLKCNHCKQWGPPSAIRRYKNGLTHHPQCWRQYINAWRSRPDESLNP